MCAVLNFFFGRRLLPFCIVLLSGTGNYDKLKKRKPIPTQKEESHEKENRNRPYHLLVTAACVLSGWLLIGEPVDGKQLAYQITEHPSYLDLQVTAVESAVALRGWQLKQEGNDLFIRARKVPVSPFASHGDYLTSIDTDGIDHVYLGGQLIWSR